MHSVGERRWEIHIDQPQPLLIALYVRDAAGLEPEIDPHLPPTDPEVPRREFPDLNREAAAAQWTAWWESLLDGTVDLNAMLPPEFTGFADAPQLRRILAACFEDAVTWAWERTAEHQGRIPDGAVESAAVHELQVRRGRTVPPFTLRVTELPVGPGDGWWLTEDHVVVSSALRSDPDAYREWLIPVLDAVA
jgi:hypothetical protein